MIVFLCCREMDLMKLSVKFLLLWSYCMLVPTDLTLLPTRASALAWDVFALKVLVEPGAEDVPGDCQTVCVSLAEDVCLVLPSFFPGNGLLPWCKPKLFFKKLEFTLSLIHLQTDLGGTAFSREETMKATAKNKHVKNCVKKVESIFTLTAGCRFWFN